MGKFRLKNKTRSTPLRSSVLFPAISNHLGTNVSLRACLKHPEPLLMFIFYWNWQSKMLVLFIL